MLVADMSEPTTRMRMYARRSGSDLKFTILVEHDVAGSPYGPQHVGMGGTFRPPLHVTDGDAENTWGRVGRLIAPYEATRVVVLAKGKELASAGTFPSDEFQYAFGFIRIPDEAPEFDESVAYDAGGRVVGRKRY